MSRANHSTQGTVAARLLTAANSFAEWSFRYVPQLLFWLLAIPFAILFGICYVLAWCLLSPDKWEEITRG